MAEQFLRLVAKGDKMATSYGGTPVGDTSLVLLAEAPGEEDPEDLEPGFTL